MTTEMWLHLLGWLAVVLAGCVAFGIVREIKRSNTAERPVEQVGAPVEDFFADQFDVPVTDLLDDWQIGPMLEAWTLHPATVLEDELLDDEPGPDPDSFDRENEGL